MHRSTKATHKRHRRVVHRKQHKAPVITLRLAPLQDLAAALRDPLPSSPSGDGPYLWLAGLAFTILAAVSLSFVFLWRRIGTIAWSS